jgi:hypothetical protein
MEADFARYAKPAVEIEEVDAAPQQDVLAVVDHLGIFTADRPWSGAAAREVSRFADDDVESRAAESGGGGQASEATADYSYFGHSVLRDAWGNHLLWQFGSMDERGSTQRELGVDRDLRVWRIVDMADQLFRHGRHAVVRLIVCFDNFHFTAGVIWVDGHRLPDRSRSGASPTTSSPS